MIMKPVAAPIPHHVLAQAYAGANHQHFVQLYMPMTHAQAGLPLGPGHGALAPGMLPHPNGLWSGPSVYHTPSLGLSHHLSPGLPLGPGVGGPLGDRGPIAPHTGWTAPRNIRGSA